MKPKVLQKSGGHHSGMKELSNSCGTLVRLGAPPTKRLSRSLIAAKK